MSVILLEHPRPKNHKRFADVVNTPLSSCLMTGYIASVLKSEHIDTEIVDANLFGWSFQKTVEELKRQNFSLLCVHLIYLWEDTDSLFEMLFNLRKEGNCAHINLYGHFPTFAFRDILFYYPFIDSVTVGEPEFTILELAEKIVTSRKRATLHVIDGLVFHSWSTGNKNGNESNGRNLVGKEPDAGKQKPEIIENKPRSVVSHLDTFPFPFRYHYELFRKKGIASYILGSRGCYGSCTFCYLDRFYGENSSWRGRSPENVFEEVYDLYQKFGERYFYFADANFFGPGKKGKARAGKFARFIIEKGLKIEFGMECRVNDIEADSLNLLVKAGLKEVFLGVENGSQNSLNRFNKMTTVEENKKAICMLRHHKIEPNYGFIMFEPESTLGDVRESFEFLKKMKMLSKPDITAHLLYHQQTLFKGMPDYEKRKDHAESISKFDYEYCYKLNDRKVSLLAESVNYFCLKVLSELSRAEDDQIWHDLCHHDEEDLFSMESNEKLINHFEETLCSLEKLSQREVQVL